MDCGKRPFLTAQWLNLAVVNFEIEPRVLAPFLPEGMELDRWREQTYVSLVGFRFRDIRVCGLRVPFHRQFDEVNLRFYVRRRLPDGWRRGVVFVREVAPRRAVAWVARWLYGENYVTAPVSQSVFAAAGADSRRSIEYAWRYRHRDYRLAAHSTGAASPARPGSEADYFLEQYWGYSGGAGRQTLEYRVVHPHWNIAPCIDAQFDGDVPALYGPRFIEALTAPPASAFLADGSNVSVFRGEVIDVGAAEPTRGEKQPIARSPANLSPANLSARQKIG